MIRRFVFAGLVAIATAAAMHAQTTTDAASTYDITTIKPHKPGDEGMMWRWQGSSYDATNVTVKSLIASAYGVRDWLVFGLPTWAETNVYDVQGKVSDPDPAAIEKLTMDERRAMLTELLRTRFNLVAHRESKAQPVYELSVMPDGAKLQATPQPAPINGEPAPKPRTHWSVQSNKLTASAMTLPVMAENLSYKLERVILDKTGLTGVYDFTLRWTPEDRLGKQTDNGTGADAPPDIFTALKEQLGLKLTATKAPVPTVVIDKITPPEPN